MRLAVGDEVSIACPICLAPMDPYRKICGSECAREMDWRRALVATSSRYEPDPESRLGKLVLERQRKDSSDGR